MYVWSFARLNCKSYPKLARGKKDHDMTSTFSVPFSDLPFTGELLPVLLP
jgi:hypothetical protein